jgi:hypothetical protein
MNALPGKTKYLVIGLGVVIVLILGILAFVPAAHGPTAPATHTTSTAETDNPEPATSLDGNVRVSAPNAEDLVTSPARVAGNVTGGGWFFENTFPVKVLDGDGKVLGQGQAQALTDWESTGTVPFAAVIPFAAPRFAAGSIVLSRDNPSGLPQNGQSFSIPVRFAPVAPGATSTAPAPVAPSGIRGSVTLGPTCPVERIPPDLACAPKPYQTSISISRGIETPEAFMTIKTDTSGRFSVLLDPGEYVLHPQSGNVFPRCNEALVTVRAGAFTDAALTCDTGIR